MPLLYHYHNSLPNDAVTILAIVTFYCHTSLFGVKSRVPIWGLVGHTHLIFKVEKQKFFFFISLFLLALIIFVVPFFVVVVVVVVVVGGRRGHLLVARSFVLFPPTHAAL